MRDFDESPDPDGSGAQQLSAWMDTCASTQMDEVLRRWHGDPEARATWHAYHLIGDVLRSEELARAPAGDEAFLQRLRLRLAHEPVPLAPANLPARRAANGWWAPAAVAAGFVAVAGLYVLQMPIEPSGPVPLAGFGPGLAVGAIPAVVVLAPPLRESFAPAAAAQPASVIRDARLDRYLDRHRHYSGGAVGPMPGAALRAADVSVGEER